LDIIKIPVKKPDAIERSKVAAYARVSTGKEEQLHSLKAQIDYYRSRILANPTWKFAGIFSDSAKTGTTKKRPGFEALIRACRAGQVDIILTKAIARFARNTVDLLNVIRELRELGIAVLFERENINTMSSDGELMLTLLASFAQAESKSNSDNVKWAVRKSYKEGKLAQLRRVYGYNIVLGEAIIIPEESEIVQEIFTRIAAGDLPNAICRDLNQREIKTLSGAKWQTNRINQILDNVFYTGNALLQKTFVTDYLSKKQVRNNGELPMYYVENSHEAIVSQELFDEAQKQKSSRCHHHRVRTKTAFSGKVICGECSAKFNRKYDRGIYKWICRIYKRDGLRGCCSKQIPESTLIDISAQVLGLDVFDETVFEAKVLSITAYNGNRLIFEFVDHSSQEVFWADRSRSESWTKEMRATAAQKTKERHERRGS